MTDTPPSLTPEILVPRLGELLVNRGLISTDQLKTALEKQSAMRSVQAKVPMVGEILVDLGYITRAGLDSAITEYVIQLRTALIEVNQQLERRVQERTAELEKAVIKLSELNQLKSNFIANISHELRTPLTHVKGYQDLILSGDLGPLTAEQTAAFQTIQRSTDRLEKLIEDLILYATSERAEMPLIPERMELIGLCKEIVDQIRSKATDQELTIDLKAPQTPILVTADREKLGWALYHLVDNAIKFTPSGGHIQMEVNPGDYHVQVKVIDTGIGIPSNRISEIFEAFHQLDGTSTRKFGGTGLGLSLVKKILDAHDAPIQVQSELGKGSQFWFTLPQVSKEEKGD